MKKLLKSFVILLAGVAIAACGNKDDGGGDDGCKGDDCGSFVDIDEMFTGAVKAGFADQIEITGSGFDPDLDFVFVGYNEGGEIKYERISPELLTIRSSRISFGVNISVGYLDKTVKVYLDRPGYDKVVISGDITFTMPSVSEGYIPDAGFRASLSSVHPQRGNPEIAKLFDAYGMIDVALAEKVTNGGCADGFPLNLYASQALSLEGIELFKSITGIVAAWDMPSIEEIDLSKWTARGISFYCERSPSLKKLVGAPWARTIICHSCPGLTHVDVHMCNWLTRLGLTEGKADSPPSSVTYLDMRRNHTGNFSMSPSKDDEFQIWGGDSFLKVAENATVKIDSWFLWDHNVANSGIASCWANIYDSWKNRNAKIEVYSRVDPHRDELLGTVPMYSVDSEALSPNNKNGQGGSANKFTVEDPYVVTD